MAISWQVPLSVIHQLQEEYPDASVINALWDANKIIPTMWENSKYCKIVCLVKCDPSTKWWATFWEYRGTCPFCMDGTEEFEAYSFNSGLIEDVKGFCMSCAGSQIYNGPKPGCQVIFFPKRIKFDPPQELRDSGEVWKVGSKWVQKCRNIVCKKGKVRSSEYCVHGTPDFYEEGSWGERDPMKYIYNDCSLCKGKGYDELSGPSFASALLIFDRRGL